MKKICAIILLSALASNFEALPQTKWSRPVRNHQGQLTRERRQFPFGEWIPLNQPCPTCRQFADSLDAGLRAENIGLTPPRPPTVTRQIQSEGNFFPQDESSILSVPPPPPSSIPRHPINANGNFQFTSFGQQFNPTLTVPTQKIFPQTQQIQFLPQTFLSNQPLLVNGNQQILSGINAQTNLFGQEQTQQQINNGKANGFNSEFKTQKLPENVVLEQNKRPAGGKQVFSNKPQPFTPSQQNQQQTFTQQQTFGGQQQSLNFGNTILTPPPAPTNVSQDIVIPGLDKEEIQLLYVPVETLRQRGTAQEQLLTQQPQNVQFFTRGNGLQRPGNNIQPTEQTLLTQPKGHFVTQNGNSQGLSDSGIKVTSAQPFSTSVTPSSLLLQNLPFQQTPQPFVSATPATPTVQPFVTPSSPFQKFSPFTPETTLSHLSTVPNNIQFSQSDIEFGTTPKPFVNQGAFKDEIITGKSQFAGLKNIEQERPFQQPIGQQQPVTQQPLLTTVFPQEQQKQTFNQQINQNQIALQKQQEQHLLQQQQQQQQQQQRQKEIEEQKYLEQQRKQKQLQQERELQEQQRRKEYEEQQLLQQQQRQKELEEQQQRQKALEQQRYLQKQKELEEQRLLQQQRQKELEQQRYLQKQKELEEQRLLQQQRQKEIEQQRFLQKQKELEEQRLLQQRQKELQEQRFLQEQRQRELENQRRLQLQKQKELEEKQRLLQKQKEEEQRLLRFQQQQKELEQQRLLQRQQEEQERILQQQKLQKQKQENLKKQQQFQFFQQQQQQQQQQQNQQQLQQQQLQLLQQKQNIPQQVFQQNKHVLPANDILNFIPELEKESEPENQQLVPHQPPLSVFFKGYNGAEARITDVLRELRSSNTITVLDQYFEKMPKVFVGPAGLIPPVGYGKFDLPYLSNIENNNVDKRIDKLPFFVAPLNFEPPPGYAKIPFPSPHVGSVVVSSETNPAMKIKTAEKGPSEDAGFSVVGPELPGLINNLGKETTTLKPTTYVSTPSLPQTTAQLRSRRPNTSIYKPQSRKPITRTRPTTTSKPEEEVTQPIQKVEVTKDPEGGIRKPFNRFLNRRRQQIKTTTEAPQRSQQDEKSLVNRFYSVDVYHKEKNQVPQTQQKSDIIQEKQKAEHQFSHELSSIDRITPSGHGVFEVRPTPDFSQVSQSGAALETEDDRPDYEEIKLQSFEDGPLPTGSAKTITQELYRPNGISQAERESSAKTLFKADGTPSSVKYQTEFHGDLGTGKYSETSDVVPTAGFVEYRDSIVEDKSNPQPTQSGETEKQEGSSEQPNITEGPRVSFAPDSSVTASGELQTKGFLNSNEQYTSAFAEISKHHHIPGFIDSSKRQHSKFSDVNPTAAISVDLQTPYSQNQQSQEYISSEVRPTQDSAEFSTFNQDHSSVKSSDEHQQTEYEGVKIQQGLDISTSQVSPTAPGATEGQYTGTGFVINSQAPQPTEINKSSDDQRIGSFISLPNVQSTVDYSANSQQFYPSSTPQPSQATSIDNVKIGVSQYTIDQSQPQVSSYSETAQEVNPSVQTYTSGSVSEGFGNNNEQSQTSEGHGQTVQDNLSNDHRLKLPNPSIVRVRTRVRGKSRGQVNFAASQSTTPVPFTRSGVDSKQNESPEPEHEIRGNHFREYNPIKTSKYQFRGVKKPVRTTTEATTEHEQKSNVYTIRPPRRPLNPSTVSTKRIRRPTTPIPSVESETETFGISTPVSYSQSEQSDISPSGVSNDVYYEQSSLSPVKHKFRKTFGSAEQKNDIVPVFVSTQPTYSTLAQEGYHEESYVEKELSPAAGYSENSDKYPEWNPSESGFDVSGIVLTTELPSGQQETLEVEEPKKAFDSKKAFDPDLEKKTGRRRVRVRVHKRPHENFETAESQNFRTVANVLVPPTSTYKPNDESSFQQLAKNADFSFGGQKLFGSRSREYFRKRLNLTQSEGVSSVKDEQQTEENIQGGGERVKDLGLVRKNEKVEQKEPAPVSSESSEKSEGGKVTRPKFRGFVRKIVKHGGGNKDEAESDQVPSNEEGKQENGELLSRQSFRLGQHGFNYTGRVNGTKHKTFVRYVKKNKIKQEDTHEESSLKGEQGLHQTTESTTLTPKYESSTTEKLVEAEKPNLEDLPSESLQQSGHVESSEAETTKESVVQTTQSEVTKDQESSSVLNTHDETLSTVQPPTSQIPVHLTQRPKFHQNLRPVFQRTTQAGLQRTKERETSTTEHTPEPHERRNGFARLKYGKTTGFGATASEKTEEAKKVNEQQLKNKNLHTLEVRKYLRTKNREGAFSQFSKNKYFTSEKTETIVNTKEQSSESEEITTERAVESSSSEPKTTQAFVDQTDSTEEENETTENDSEQISTTETLSSSEEESSEEVTTVNSFETTTEAEALTTITHEAPTTVKFVQSTEPPTTISDVKVTEPKITIQTTEEVEIGSTEQQPDIYRFSKNSFSFDEAEKFIGTKNRAHVRNITTDIIENTASFSAPGIEKRPEIYVVTHNSEDENPTTESRSDSTRTEKTEVETTELARAGTTTLEYPQETETETAATTDAVTKSKIAKVLKTSTTTKISHETEICYKGKCIRTKSDNPDDDLKLLVDSASTMKIQKRKT